MASILPPTVSRHDDVRRLLADKDLRANFAQVLELFGVTGGPFHDWMARSPLNHDGDEHRRWRTLMSRTFTPRSVARVRPFLARTADDLADALVDGPTGTCELMAAFADPLPALGLCELIGVPADDRGRFRTWAASIGLGFRPTEITQNLAEIDAALVDLLGFARALVVERREHPTDDLVSALAAAIGTDGYDLDDMAAFTAGLVFAGNDTTRNQIGWMVATLAERPDWWDAIAAGDIALDAAVEETLRYRSAVTNVSRTPPDGVPVLLSLWDADRDPDVYPAPDRLDVANTAPHLAFGHGAHHCLGAALARAELVEALRALVERYACPVVVDSEWSPPLGINGPLRLVVELRSRRSA